MNSGGSQMQRGHLQLAAQYTRDAWFPGFPRPSTGAAGSNGNLNLQEIKSDLSLASSVLRLLLNSQTSDAGLSSPFTRLHGASQNEIEKLVAAVGPSKHVLSHMAASQSARLKESLVSVSAAEALSSTFGVERELAYSCALLRQLGLSLMAWNYPHVFKRAFTVIRPKETLELALGKILGFTPALLCLTILRADGGTSSLLHLVGDTGGAAPESIEARIRFDQLQTLCLVSEAMARATSDAPYPSAPQDWDLAQGEFEKRLGKNAWHVLEETLDGYLERYSAVSPPGAFAMPARIAATLTKTRTVPAGPTLFERNEYAQRCAEPLQNALRDFYRLLASGARDAEALDFMMRTVIPSGEFDRGALFIREKDANALKPRQVCGTWNTHAFLLSPPKYVADAVNSAAVSRTPLQGIEASTNTCWIAGVIGEAQRGAVLIAEFTAAKESRAGQKLTAFRALHQAASDALGIY